MYMKFNFHSFIQSNFNNKVTGVIIDKQKKRKKKRNDDDVG